jgi:tellurite resistance protein
MRGSKITKNGFLQRRRARQRDGGSARERAYTFDLAALHLRLLVAMAAVDEEVRHVEVEEVLGFIDRPSLGRDELARLEELARVSLAAPPQVESLLGELTRFARRPSIARAVVDDLARVAAADLREDPRETRMLESVCDALQLERVEIQLPEAPAPNAAPTTGATGPRTPAAGGPRLVARHRARTAVRRALEASYREDAERDA